jgi:hypothetical protein
MKKLALRLLGLSIVLVALQAIFAGVSFAATGHPDMACCGAPGNVARMACCVYNLAMQCCHF